MTVPGPVLDGATRLAAVIGSPVRHSLSPALHNAAFAATGLNWAYVAFEVAPGQAPEALAAMRTLGLGGLSVTMPHKAAVAAAVDRLTPAAAALGAVNCVVPRDGELWGYNTDGEGFVDALEAEASFSVAGRSAAVVGAGGAARAVIVALVNAGAAAVTVVNRTPERAVAAAALGGGVAVAGTAEDIARCELVVNATSVGMGSSVVGASARDLPFDPALVAPGQLVVDLVYQPLETPLMVAAAARGAAVCGGVGMLLHQAARAFELWTGVAAPVAAMRTVLAGALNR